jgi:hypothetical protein
MILTIVAVLLILWLLGILTHVGAIIHLLLIAALIVFIYDRIASRHV